MRSVENKDENTQESMTDIQQNKRERESKDKNGNNEKNEGLGFWFEKWKNSKLSTEKKEKVVIFFLLGVFFLLVANPLSSFEGEKKVGNTEKKNSNSDKIEENDENDAYIALLENKLEKTISGMEGAGKVQVMITLKDSGQKILDKNQPYESSSERSKEEGKESEKSSTKSEQETVLVEVEGNTTPIVIQERYPEVEGVVIVCEGGDNQNLSLRIKEAVQALFSVDSHKIVVCKLQQ